MEDHGPANAQQVLPNNTSLPSAVSDAVSVLVTGFGVSSSSTKILNPGRKLTTNQPFKTHLVNASFLIASSLPSTIALPAPGSRCNISVHVHPSPIPVSYSSVRETISAILDDFANSHAGLRPDIIIHIGIASTQPYYIVETQAHRDSYNQADINGRSGNEDGEKIWRKKGFPGLLRPGPAASATILKMATTRDFSQQIDQCHPSSKVVAYPPNNHFLSTWKSFVPLHADLRISYDAGRYLCEFIFYTTMSQLMSEGRDRNVIFFHVPDSCDDGDIEMGRKVAVALIKTLVTCWIEEAKT
jgi:pyrrolidone-carboxylate peptidase